MGYVRAQDVLPADVLARIQEYVSGEYLYVPKKDGDKKPWGANTGGKQWILARNALIFDDYQNGHSFDALAARYFLSEKSVRRICGQQKKLALAEGFTK